MKSHYDIIIVGGGMVGLTLAGLLGQQQFSVAVIEARQPQACLPDDEYDLRVSAINKSSQQVFNKLNVWSDMLFHRACAYQHMHVWDASGDGSIHFDAADLGIDSLGHIIENRVIQHALYEQIQQLDTVDCLCPLEITSIHYDSQSPSVQLATGETICADLLVGADGANSSVRAAADIAINQSAYEQKGIVTTVKSSLHHKDTAWQRFLSTGPLAFLPLSDGRCSIVWSAENNYADELMAMSDQLFIQALQDAFDSSLGTIESIGQRAAFPLVRRHAEEYVKTSVALVGDAAHTIHPLAGQGVNLGILDAAALAEIIVQARAKGKDISSLNTLRKYERWRRADNTLMMYSMSGFKQLFGNELTGLSLIRNAGLNLVDNMGMVKHRFMRHALGLEGDLPAAAKMLGW